MAAGFVESADCLVDFIAANGAAGFETISGGEFTSGSLLSGNEVTEEYMPVSECFLDDKGI